MTNKNKNKSLGTYRKQNKWAILNTAYGNVLYIQSCFLLIEIFKNNHNGLRGSQQQSTLSCQDHSYAV